MPFNGSGVFVRNYSWVQDAANNIDIDATRMDADTDDITGNGLSQCMTRDGQGAPSANIPFSAGLQTDTINPFTPNGPVSFSAGQIKFPAVQNSSSNANTLDDYEEGTWTPSVGGSATYNSRSGSYTKIGRLVLIRGALDVNVLGTGSATVISGIPFTSASAGDYGGSCPYFANVATSVVSLVPRVGASSTNIAFAALTAAATSISLAPNLFQDTAQIFVNIPYEASA